MSWRVLASWCVLGVAVGCASPDGAHPAGQVASSCEEAAFRSPDARHLGDGVTDYHYSVISDYLREFPGSAAETRAAVAEEREADEAEPGTVKPYSSGVLETEFSHLLGAIARDNGGIGAAVFDTHGLMVGLTGVVLEDVVLPADRLAMLRQAPVDPPVEVHYSCEQLAGDCTGPITAYYRPVLDYDHDPRFVGVGLLVMRDRPPCEGAAH